MPSRGPTLSRLGWFSYIFRLQEMARRRKCESGWLPPLHPHCPEKMFLVYKGESQMSVGVALKKRHFLFSIEREKEMNVNRCECSVG